MRSFVALFRTPTKGVSIDPDATEGAIVGENLFIRQTDGTLALFEPSSGVVTPAVGNAVVVTVTSAGAVGAPASVGGSNSGYQQDISPAASPTNFDLDASMIAGLNNPQFPTLNYILVGNGAQWVAVPMSGDATILASGAISVNKLHVARTIAMSGDGTWTVSFDGSGNVTAAMTLGNTAVTPGSYTATNLTVDAKGRITAASNGSAFTSPLTTKGDLYGHSTVDARIPVGADTFVLTADSTQTLGVKWAAAGSISSLTNTHILVGNASNVPTDVAMSGDATIANTGAVTIANSAVTNAKLANMAAHTVKANITAGSAAPTDSSLSSIIVADSLLTTKGDLVAFSTVPVRFPVGADGTVVTASSSSSSGLTYQYAGGVGVFFGRPVPVTGSFSTFGTAVTATDCTAPPRLKFSLAASAGVNLGGLTQASISAPYTIDLGFVNSSNAVAGGASAYMGIVLADSGGTPKFRVFGMGGIAATISAVLDSWTNTNSDVRPASQQVGGQSTTFMRVTNDATTLRYYLSQDGLSYSLMFSEAVNTFVTPTKFGIGATNQVSVEAKYDIFFWAVTASVLGDAP